MNVEITLYQLDKNDEDVMKVVHMIDEFNECNKDISKTYRVKYYEFSQESYWWNLSIYDSIKLVRLYKKIKKKLIKIDDSVCIYITIN